MNSRFILDTKVWRCEYMSLLFIWLNVFEWECKKDSIHFLKVIFTTWSDTRNIFLKTKNKELYRFSGYIILEGSLKIGLLKYLVYSKKIDLPPSWNCIFEYFEWWISILFKNAQNLPNYRLFIKWSSNSDFSINNPLPQILHQITT